ncbi:MAG TPA: hypothetical protein VGK48_09130 [Terriglobia bacterium]
MTSRTVRIPSNEELSKVHMQVSTEGAYSQEWRRYRRWSRAFWLLFFFYLPAMDLAGHAIGPLRRGGPLIFGAALLWMGSLIAVGYPKINFRCPRCRELFFRKFDDRPWRMSWQHNPFARRCMHCGLPKWASNPVDV